MSAHKWTREDEDKIITMWNAGECASAIGNSIGITRQMVSGKIFRLRAMGVWLRKIENEAYAPRREWSSEETAQMHSLLAEGKTYAEVSTILHRTASSVKQKALAARTKRQVKAFSEYNPLPKLNTRVIPDTRSLTGRIMGDPPSERSALFRRAS